MPQKTWQSQRSNLCSLINWLFVRFQDISERERERGVTFGREENDERCRGEAENLDMNMVMTVFPGGDWRKTAKG